MLIFILFSSFFLIIILHLGFFFASKSNYWEQCSKSIFECGFTSYHYSRFSFPVHYFMIALTFLFLDLELCFLMPFFHSYLSNSKVFVFFIVFTFVLTMALIWEWSKGMLDWKN